jgi:hypothetical protein
MLMSAKGSFFSFFEIDYVLMDILIIWVGIEKNRFKKSDFRFFGKFCLIYIAFVVFRFVFLNNLATRFLLSDLNFLVKYILLSFLYCAVLKEKALEHVVKITMWSAMVSVPLYAVQLLAGDFLYKVGSIINLPPRLGNPLYTNFLIYTFDRGHAIRNAGFSWEPGAYGCFLGIGLLFHLLTNNFVLDRKAKWAMVAIITTLSTTTYIALVIILLMYYRANGGKINKFIIIAAPIICIVAFQVPFMLDKIIEIYNHDLEDVGEMQNLTRYYLKNGGQLPLNRFGSVIYIYNLFGVKLIWGISNIFQEATSALSNVNISNGLIDFVAKFGVIGVVVYIYKYILLLKKLIVEKELIVYAVVILLLLSFGEPMLIFQSSLAFLFLYHYTSSNQNDDHDLNENFIPDDKQLQLSF